MATDDQGPAVETTSAQGVIRGVDRGGVFAFKGIPYAGVLNGIDKWRPPQKAESFDKPFEAIRYGPACPQSVPSVPHWFYTEGASLYVDEIVGMVELEGEPQGSIAFVRTYGRRRSMRRPHSR